ncbi:MAG: DUF2807 domain-containing protein [Paracoccaceae bacterium]
MPFRPVPTFVAGLVALSLSTAMAQAIDSTHATQFSRIEVTGNVKVHVTGGDVYSITETGKDNGVEIRHETGTLVIQREAPKWTWGGVKTAARGETQVVHVSLPYLKGIELHDGAAATVSGMLTKDLNAVVKQGGRLDVENLDAAEVRLLAHRGAVITASGMCEALDVTATQGARIDVAQLECGSGEFSASLGAEVLAKVDEARHVSASLGALVDLQGGARVTHADIGVGSELRK